ncbi:MAG: fused MFS/spermidine synthase [Pseudomonadota bacterium]
MRELTQLFGATSHATAGTLAVFFGGLAIGGAIWSHRAPRVRLPLREYGILEIGVGVSGALYFCLIFLYAKIYTPLHEALGETSELLLLAKMFLAAFVLLPPAILMGGTLPLLCQHVVGNKNTLGRTGALLYGVNTMGAASGALAAGFWLPKWVGFNGAYLVAMAASLVIGGIAWSIGRHQLQINTRSSQTPTSESRQVSPNPRVSLTSPVLVAAALLSGMLALGLEVLWTRMFQQVLQNSVYTFSVILVVFLAALSTGAFVARLCIRISTLPWRVLAFLSILAGIGALSTPFVFFEFTDGMRYLGAGEQWSTYLISVFAGTVAVLFIPGVAVGTVFPYLLRVAERSGEAGKVLGRLSAINTAGAIAGSLIAGFVMLGEFGLWRSMQIVALAYFLLAILVAMRHSRILVVGSILSIVFLFTYADPSGLPGVRLNAKSEKLLASWEGPDGHVSVIERRNSLRIKVNNFYALGSSAAMEHEQNQTLIPLMPHPSPERLFYLGMGTGITAGAGLRLPSQDITVTELIPEVITAGAQFFDKYALGLFNNDKARIIPRDGRNELRGRNDQYDAILADLFVPWRAGVGNVYSRDHYATARDRLRPGGIYVQWIPLYQVTDIEFWTIVRTFLDVFPQVRVWRGDFYVEKPILALVGSVDAKPFSTEAVLRNGRHLSGRADLNPTTFLALTLPFYAGNLGESREIVPKGPIHTDNNPVIDYQAPISHRNARAGNAEWFVGIPFLKFLNELLETTPPQSDPYLSELDSSVQNFVVGGLSYYNGAVFNNLGHKEEAQRYYNNFIRLLPVRVDFKTDGERSSNIEEVTN